MDWDVCLWVPMMVGIVAENASRTRADPEYEILDTGVFDEDRYFDVEVEYA